MIVYNNLPDSTESLRKFSTFLRTIPILLDTHQRIQIFSMMYYIDTILRNYEDTLHIIKEYSGMIDEKFPIDKRYKLLGSIWEIVETLDGIRQLLPISKGLFDQANSYNKVVTNLEKARALRNQRQHLSNNIRNHSKAKFLEPIHGVVMWNYGIEIYDDHADFFTHCTSIDPIMHKFRINLAETFDSVRGNFDNITLRAFGKGINVSQCIWEFSVFCDETTLLIERDLNNAPIHATRSNELPEEQQKPFNIIAKATLQSDKVLSSAETLPDPETDPPE